MKQICNMNCILYIYVYAKENTSIVNFESILYYKMYEFNIVHCIGRWQDIYILTT